MTGEGAGFESGPQILLCQCERARLLPSATVDLLTDWLRQRGWPVMCVPDLCELAAHADSALKQFIGGRPLAVAACHSRAVRWLFAAAQVPLPTQVTLLNLRSSTQENLLAALEQISSQPEIPGETTPARSALAAGVPAETQPLKADTTPHPAEGAALPGQPNSWYPWFPVIDFSRCTQCMQCLSFCLFGVFGVTPDRRIAVQQPQNCKANCPACSRVCPETAIIFPKYGQSPINGEEINPQVPLREAVKVDISALLGGDIYEVLQHRNQRAHERFSAARDPEQALRERRLCLAKLAELGDLPPEVLMSLPSREEIHRRADEAAAKARAAREKKPS
jgi:NAD-dependent dihydropyrimidine dehydrogenase PreA subunit